jgi:hypothetical protein
MHQSETHADITGKVSGKSPILSGYTVHTDLGMIFQERINFIFWKRWYILTIFAA